MQSWTLKMFLFISLGLAFGVTVGCGPTYYLVTSEYVSSDAEELQAEVVETELYHSAVHNIQVIAVKAPESCADETATQSSGQATGSKVLLKTTCGIEMGELERGLAKAGFRVTSWKVLNNLIENEKITPIAAAKRLKAQVLLQINSLERSSIQTGKDARWDRRFYKSNLRREKLKPAEVQQATAKELAGQVGVQESTLLQRKRLSTTINASATLVETGQAIWFYEWTHAEAKHKELQAEAFVSCDSCDSGICCVPMVTRSLHAETLVTGDSTAISIQRNVSDLEKATYHKLLREIVEDLVGKFKQTV